VLPLPLGFRQSGDDVTEAGERLVDLLALLEPLARCSRHTDTLGASQVDQVELTDLQVPAKPDSVSGGFRKQETGSCASTSWCQESFARWIRGFLEGLIGARPLNDELGQYASW
jgi:hypothetical protein